MATIIANSSFAYGPHVYQRGNSYDTAVAAVAAANTAVPHLFYTGAGTKTANTSFVYHDTRAGGFDRLVGRGELLPSNDQAVTSCPRFFV